MPNSCILFINIWKQTRIHLSSMSRVHHTIQSICFQINELGEKVSNHCAYKQFPNDPHENRRLPCNAPLLVRVNRIGGNSEYRPRYLYEYQPIMQSLQRLLKTLGFEEMLEHWIPNQIYMMAKSGKNFKQTSILKNKRCIGINGDFSTLQTRSWVLWCYLSNNHEFA